MIEITFKVTTPLLLRRGAISVDNGNYYYSDISGQTFRGLLRWWFRFYVLNIYPDHKLVRGLEDILFGGSSVCASPLVIYPSLEDEATLKNWETESLQSLQLSMPYFTKFRLSLKRNKCKYLPPDSRISVKIFPQMYLEDERIKKSILRIFRIYSLLFATIGCCGGIGPAWRRGLGSLQLDSFVSKNKIWDDKTKRLLDKACSMAVKEELIKNWIKECEKKIEEELTELIKYTNKDFLKKTSYNNVRYCVPNAKGFEIYEICTGKTWQKALEDVLYPNNSRIDTRGEPPTTFLWKLRVTLKGKYRDSLLRAFLGYPLRDYKRHPTDLLAEDVKKLRKLRIERIPSSLIITIKKDVEGLYHGIALYLPYWRYCDIWGNLEEVRSQDGLLRTEIKKTIPRSV